MATLGPQQQEQKPDNNKRRLNRERFSRIGWATVKAAAWQLVNQIWPDDFPFPWPWS